MNSQFGTRLMFILLVGALCLPIHTVTRTVGYVPGQVGKETILKEKQEVESVSHRLLPPIPSPLLHLSMYSLCWLALFCLPRSKLLTYKCCFSNKPSRSPEPVLGTQWNTHFSSFLSLIFAARQFVAAVLNLSQGILAAFFSLLSLFSQTWPWPRC